jgi:selenocysteine-specific elongation factor
MIVATAGHVDHGKTTLVQALTGIDTDRLAEEKRRGMSIDLGFAYADFGSALPIGFIDVPGHERFVRNMLAGFAAVDFALLVVAADDGPMPQTREHVAILDLLGLKWGAVALTKIDRVTPARLAEAKREITALLSMGGLCDAAVFPVSAPSDAGLSALRAHLTMANRAWQARSSAGNFRLAVDRSFTIDGAGLVVTGAVLSGSARVGDHLLVSPQGMPVRVRSIHAQNRPAQLADAGQRCALNLSGLDLKRIDVTRGNWIVAPPAHAPTVRIDVRLRVLGSETRAFAHWTPVHLHIGAASLSARVATLGARAIAAGTSGLAQLVINTPISAVHADRFILRDQSALRTIAGGIVLDPFGATRGRSKPNRLSQLAAMERPAAADSLLALLVAEPTGVHLPRFAQTWNLTANETSALQGSLPIKVVPGHDGPVALGLQQWEALRSAICAALAEWHLTLAQSLGPTDIALARQLGARTLTVPVRAAIKSLLEEGRVVREGVSLRLPGYRAQLRAEDAALLQQVSELLQVGGLRPPIVGELAAALNMALPLLLEFLKRVSALGHLVPVAKNRFFLPTTFATLVQIAQTIAAESADGMFEAALYRDRSGIGRNLTIQVLEFLDRTGETRLANDKRSMLT